ncbi:hypothetical protein KM043_001092 [Ampulex compressa]|nr:hypothetical protein KM043_001092 [Ampulex compressa]
MEEERRRILESNWGGYALDIQLWDDSRAPTVKIRSLEEMVLDDSESNGYLSDRLIGAASSFLTRSPENGLYIHSKCVLRRMGLADIASLRYHRYLQYIDLSYNNISDVSALDGIPYLMYLNMSHNRLDRVLNFTPPWYLTYVNLSYNCITTIRDLSAFWSITRLDLSHNAIEVIAGLQNLKYLQYLNLSYNLIERIENLDNLNIQELNLEANCITSFQSTSLGAGLNVLPNLRTILLGRNRLSSLEFFKDAEGLRLIDLKSNKINDLLEVSNLRGLIYEIDLRGNPCTKWPNYRDVLLSSIPSLIFIDGAEVFITEKVSAATIFTPSLDMLAARTVTKLTLLEQLNVPKIDLHVRPYDEINPPLIILTGPSAVKKTALALHIVQTIPKKVIYCRWYTTKQRENSEEEDRAFIFVTREEFNNIARRGDFLAIQELLGNSYGFHFDQIISLVSERKIGISQTDLNAAVQITKRYSNAKVVLVFTKSVELHRLWVEEKFDVFTWIKDSMENLLAVKIGKRISESGVETASSKLNFIEELVEEIVDNMELPSYGVHVRPQGTGATATDIILESKMMLPKVVITRTQMESEQRKRLTFQSLESIVKFDRQKELKVILDEESNIIIDDDESKRKRYQEKMMLRRSTMEAKGIHYRDEELGESESSEDSILEYQQAVPIVKEKPENLKNTYTDLVLKSREIYAEQHKNKPGFFSLVVLMDDYGKAFNTLLDYIYDLYADWPTRKPVFSTELDYFTQTAVPEAIKSIVKEIRNTLSTSMLQRKTLLRTQGVTSWKDIIPGGITKDADNTAAHLLNSIDADTA